MFSTVLGWLLKGPLDRLFDTIDHKVDNETERQKIKSDVTKTFANNRAQVLIHRTWLLQFLFAIPVGLWFAAVNIYSVFWCSACAYPQDWTIAALPSPLDEWAGAIILGLFFVEVGKGFTQRR